MNPEGKIILFEQFLGVKFPEYYKEFLKHKGSAIIDGFKILGLPTKLSQNWKINSILDSTQILRRKRPDLPTSLVAICISGSKTLCLDLEKGNEEDAPLVEIDLQNNTPPKALGKTFKEWVEEHEAVAKRFSIAWNRIKNRRGEVKGKDITQWKSIIVRVKDYVIGVAAFRYNPQEGCLEVDEFFPIDQPHIKRGEAIRVLLTEMFSRARNYSGSLKVIFTKDIREDKEGVIPEEFQNLPEWKYRKPTLIPKQIVKLGEEYGIRFKEKDKGRISHEEGVNLWFKMLGLPQQIEERIKALEEAGYLRKELIAQVISTGIWSREEAIWFFLNAPSPEAILLGSDLPEKRLLYADSFNYARAALLATRFKQAIIAEITDEIIGASLSPEEIEKIKVECHLEPQKNFWILKCNRDFNIPSTWIVNGRKLRVKSGEPVLLLSRPKYSANPEEDKTWIKKQVEVLSNSKINAKYRCLLLSNEMINPLILNIIYKNQNPEKIREELIDVIKYAEGKGVYVLFAPTRMHLLLDREIHRRMRTARRFSHFPSTTTNRLLKLKIVVVPKKVWETPGAISNASEDAKTFASFISNKIDIHRSRESFNFNCETVERFALMDFPVIAELQGEECNELLEALNREDENYKGIMFSYVKPEEMKDFLGKIRSSRLKSIFRKIDGGIVVVNSPWESLSAPLKRGKKDNGSAEIDDDFRELLNKILLESKNKRYYGKREEIARAHKALQEAFYKNIPLSIFGIRDHIFIQTIRDYIYYQTKIEEKEKKIFFLKRRKRYEKRIPSSMKLLEIAYGDGTKGESFPLFLLPKIEKPTGNFLKINIALISSRHMKVDYFVDFSLMRNAPIQWKETSADQEEYAFRRTYEKIDSLLKFLRGEIDEENLELPLRVLLRMRKEMKEKNWQGLEIHLYHATGLTPVSVGVYRAIIHLLMKYRGQLIVIPRLIDGKKRKEKRKEIMDKFGLNKIEADYYERAEEWY